MSEEIIWLFFKYDNRLRARELHCRWCVDKKLWYIYKCELTYEHEEYVAIILKNVKYADKDIVKNLGATWRAIDKEWLIATSMKEKFKSYL